MLYLSHFSVHTPIEAKRELVDTYAQKTPGTLHHNVAMATMIKATDEGIGRILDSLDHLNLTTNTVVIFYSDNGGYGPATDMYPLKGYKGTYYEGGIRVPLAVRWPGHVAPGSVSDALVTGVDIFPTICEIMGAPLPAQQIADGQSLLPVLSGQDANKDRPLFWHFPAYLQSYRETVDEQRDPLFRSRPVSVVRLGDWKLHHYYEDDAYELYNLRQDIGETHNVYSDFPAPAAQLRQVLNDWIKTTHADVPRLPNPDFNEAKHARARAAAAKP